MVPAMVGQLAARDSGVVAAAWRGQREAARWGWGWLPAGWTERAHRKAAPCGVAPSPRVHAACGGIAWQPHAREVLAAPKVAATAAPSRSCSYAVPRPRPSNVPGCQDRPASPAARAVHTPVPAAATCHCTGSAPLFAALQLSRCKRAPRASSRWHPTHPPLLLCAPLHSQRPAPTIHYTQPACTHPPHRLDVADVQGGLLAAVDVLPAVHALGRDEQLLVGGVANGVAERHLRAATGGGEGREGRACRVSCGRTGGTGGLALPARGTPHVARAEGRQLMLRGGGSACPQARASPPAAAGLQSWQLEAASGPALPPAAVLLLLLL